MIRNYTSTVPAGSSVQLIKKQLLEFGAKNIMESYNDKKELIEIAFIVSLPDGKEVPFRLPARLRQIEIAFYKERNLNINKVSSKVAEQIKLQAQRTAWKTIQEWVQMQLDLIKLDQIEFMEAFLPYAWNPQTKQTFFESVKEKGFKPLELM